MNQRDVFNLIEQVSGQANILTVPRLFITITGDIKNALFLSQVIYWAGKMGGEFYKTMDDWQDETTLTRYEVDKARRELEGIVITRVKKANGSPTVYYSVNYEALADRIMTVFANEFVKNSQNQLSKIDNSLTEITSENNNQPIENVAISENGIVYEDCDIDGNPKKAKKAKTTRPRANPPELFAIAQAVADVTGVSLAVNRAMIFKAAKNLILDDRVSPELIRSTYGPGGLWWSRDWRGRDGQKPGVFDIQKTLFTYDRAEDSTIRGGVKNRDNAKRRGIK